jgi:uncharacterized iron-regulated membrane protein
MTDIVAGPATGASARSTGALYRAIWRWHFYAGLFALPFLILLAVTGGLYLFKDEIDLARHADLLTVSPVDAPRPPSQLVAAALAAQPGTAVKLITPAAANRSAEVIVDGTDGARHSVYVDPGSAKVLGSLVEADRLMLVVRRLHSLIILGDGTNRVIEIVGGWTVVLVITGLYLWWPRGQRGGVVSIRATPGKRVFWRDLHAVTGLAGGAFVLFLALSGMPWSGVFGDWLNRGMTAAGAGYPTELWDDVPKSTVPMGETGQVAWTLENAPVPLSSATGAAPIGLDQAVGIATARGISPGFTLALPTAADGVYSATIFPDTLSAQRAIHIDQYSGSVLADIRFADYGLGAKAVEFGINIHMGQEFGLGNQMLMLAACLSIILMAVAALVMWWKRRPAGGLGVPPAANARTTAVASILILLIALLFPLTAASLAVVLVLEVAYRAFKPANR